MKQDPPTHPMAMMMALDEDFELLYKDKDDGDENNNVDEDSICGLTVRNGHAITFTNELFHAGRGPGQTIQVKPYTVCLHTL
jgi:hypothetical protein